MKLMDMHCDTISRLLELEEDVYKRQSMESVIS